jgi:hypothetical protein
MTPNIARPALPIQETTAPTRLVMIRKKICAWRLNRFRSGLGGASSLPIPFPIPSSTMARHRIRTTRVRPRLETLEDRWQPSCVVINSGPTLLIIGDNADNSVAINDDGAGSITATCDGTSSSFDGIQRVVIKTRGGNDHIEYELDPNADLVSARKLQIETGTGDDFVSLNFQGEIQAALRTYLKTGIGDDIVLARFGTITGGAGPGPGPESQHALNVNAQLQDGDDTFDVFLEGGIVNIFRAVIRVQGGTGDDSLNAHALDTDILTTVGFSSKLSVSLRGDDGEDFIGIDFAGTMANSAVDFRADGGRGDDTIVCDLTLDRLDIAVPIAAIAQITGGLNEDNLTLNVNIPSGPPFGNFLLDGGSGFDFGMTNHPDLVTVVSAELP